MDFLLNLGEERISLLYGLEDEINKLRLGLPLIQAVLNDAEEKQTSRSDVRIWLRQLKLFSYDLEDVFDEFEIEVTTHATEESFDDDVDTRKGKRLRAVFGNERSSLIRQCKNILGNIFSPYSSSTASSRLNSAVTFLNIADRVKALMNTFEDLLKTKEKLDLMIKSNYPIFLTDDRKQPSKRPETSSTYEVQFVMVGRDQDKKELIEKLLQNDEQNQPSEMSKVSLLSIVGMGGIGKSTLAKVVYNDPSITRHFQTKKWVFVGDTFDPKGLIAHLLDEHHNQGTIDLPLELLHEKLKNKCKDWGRFFIVFDDVWNDDKVEWEKLWFPLTYGTNGSKVLITCRSQIVMTSTLHDPTIVLKGLDYDSCFSIFVSHAFPTGGFEVHSNLVSIGKKIVEKLDGLPLAAKVVGSSLFGKLDEETWIMFLKSEPWATTGNEENVMGSLMWSYNNMPTHLKQCFGYCSLLCKNRSIKKESLILKWIASGLIQPEGRKELEDIGHEYFTTLVQLSFFEVTYDIWGSKEYMIHDLIHDLAQLVASRECKNFSEKKYQVTGNNEHPRHLFLDDTKIMGIQDYKIVRTIIIEFPKFYGSPSNDLMKLNELLVKLQYVRVLDITNFFFDCPHDFEGLPVSHLRHLRYLNVPHPRCLSDSITDLKNLQCLIITPLFQMNDNVYIRHMRKLVNLCYLGGKFIVGKENGYKIEELGDLRELRGCLSLGDLEEVENKDDARKGRINEKEHLKGLNLCWGSCMTSLKQRPEYEQVLEGLEPHRNVKELHIRDYMGLQFPTWVSDATVLSNLQDMSLEYCYAPKLPALGQLRRLKTLRLIHLEEVCTIEKEFYGSWNESTLTFPSLEELHFNCLNNWTNWSGEHWHFPSLHSLEIRYSEKLSSLPSRFNVVQNLSIYGCVPAVSSYLAAGPNIPVRPIFPLLKYLHISEVKLLDTILSNATIFCDASTLEKVEVCGDKDTGGNCWGRENGRGDQWEQFTSLRCLIISSCSELLYLSPNLHRLPSLETLAIHACNRIVEMPNGGLPKSLQLLTIGNDATCLLKRRCEDTGLDWPKISHVQNLDLHWK